jgi:hypothetical protein
VSIAVVDMDKELEELEAAAAAPPRRMLLRRDEGVFRGAKAVTDLTRRADVRNFITFMLWSSTVALVNLCDDRSLTCG